jgi:hypothetical protein
VIQYFTTAQSALLNRNIPYSSLNWKGVDEVQ